MQKQQHITETILLKEHLNDDDGTEKTVSVDRYRVISDKTFMDGFVLTAGSPVRKVIGSKEEYGCLNVIYDIDLDVKRVMWVKTDNLEHVFSGDATLDNEDYKNEINDRDEHWGR